MKSDSIKYLKLGAWHLYSHYFPMHLHAQVFFLWMVIKYTDWVGHFMHKALGIRLQDVQSAIVSGASA